MGECVFSGSLRRASQSVSQGPETGQKIMAENGVFRRPSPEHPGKVRHAYSEMTLSSGLMDAASLSRIRAFDKAGVT